MYLQIEHPDSRQIPIGYPIQYKNSLIGMVSFKDDDHIYCLPSYYILKIFSKNNKIEMPDIDFIPYKINNYLVKDNHVFHPSIGINMPISCYFLLESNKSLDFYKLEDNKEILHSNNIIDDSLISNFKSIITNSENFFQLNTYSLHLLKHYNNKLAVVLLEELKSLEKVSNIKFKY